MRVWNLIDKGNQSEGFRCTICGVEIKSNALTALKKK